MMSQMNFKVLLLLVITIASVLVNTECQDESDMPSVEKDGGIDKMKGNLVGLYEAIHFFALPDLDTTKDVEQRFVLQIPGKVLNPADYHPGDEYEIFLKNPHKAQKEVHIPPMVMEKMFQLADVVPGSRTLTGGETGYSLARIYEAILGTMDVVDFAELSAIGKNVYEESLEKLLEPLPDPENSNQQIPLLQLYSQFQEKYHDEQRDMENKIKEKEKELSAVDFQLWFQRHFHILNAKVEGAYTKWLLYGRKHLVESYIAHFDITSSGEILEDARVKMRSAGFSTLDRSQIAYPVSFTPSNWYKYLENKEAPLTRDQLLAKLESVNTRITLLQAMRDTTTKELKEADGDMKNVIDERDSSVTKLKDKTKELEESRKKCWLSVGPFKSSTCDIADKEGEISELLSESTSASLKASTLNFQFGAKSQMSDQIGIVLKRLELERENLQSRLDKSEPSSSSPLVDEVGTTEPLAPQEIQDNWLMFDYSSTKSSKESESFSMETSSTIKASYSFIASGSVSASVGKQSFSEHVRSADVKVKAKFLKVKINRPWFRIDLFKNREFTLQRQSTPVSPGPMLEKSFNDLKAHEYLLYQYPTAFLLAKEVTLEFSGLDAQTKQSALSTSFGASAKVGWGPFSVGGSSSTSTSSSQMRASSTATGLKVEIPGAQLIGYYCDIVPKFPNPIV